MGRRTGLLLAALLVGAVVAVGVLSSGLPSAAPRHPVPSASSPQVTGDTRTVFALSVDVTTAGTVWLTTAGGDCGGCVLVWRRGPDDDGWSPLRQVGSDHRPGQIRVADSGGDGLLGGAGLWLTHDGGDNWSAEEEVTVSPGDVVQAEIAGAYAWALVRGAGSPPVLWRASLDELDWRKVSLPAPLDPDAAPVAVGDALLLWVTGDSGPGAVVTSDGGRTWEPLDRPCGAAGGRVGTTAAYASCLRRRGLELVVRDGGGWETWPLAGALGPAGLLSPQAAASSVATAPGGTGYAVVRGNLLRTRDRGGSWAPVE